MNKVKLINDLEKKMRDGKSKEEKKREVVETAGEVLGDVIIELVYDDKAKKTALAIYKDGEVSIKDNYIFNDKVLVPISASNGGLKMVKFPSDAIDYESSEKLVKEIKQFIHKYISVSEFFEEIAAYYVMFSWVYDDFNELPYLRVIGDYGQGKTRFLNVVGYICYKAIIMSGATTLSPIFRLIDQYKGTIVLDEADFKDSTSTNELIKVINNGFTRGLPVLRSEAKKDNSFNPVAFDVFSPKVFATREHFNDEATESRMITEDMTLNEKRADIPISITNEFYVEALKLRNKLLMFRFKHKAKYKINTQNVIEGIESRLNQIALPVMSIIDDQEAIGRLANYLIEYNNKIISERQFSNEGQFLQAIFNLFENGNEEPTVKEILNKYDNGLGYNEKFENERKVGWFLRKVLGLKTHRTNRGFVLSKENDKKLKKMFDKYYIKSERSERSEH